MTIPPYLKSHFLVAAIIFGLLLAAVTVLIILPSFREIRLIRQQVLDERVRLEKLYLKGQLQRKVRENYERIQPRTAWLDNILLKENQELQYITALENLAERVGLRLKITVGESERLPSAPLSRLQFVLALEGRWPQIVRFLANVEDLPYYTHVLEITAAKQATIGEETAGSQTAATVTLATFWLIP